METDSDLFVFKAINLETKQQWISSISTLSLKIDSALVKCNRKGEYAD